MNEKDAFTEEECAEIADLLLQLDAAELHENQLTQQLRRMDLQASRNRAKDGALVRKESEYGHDKE